MATYILAEVHTSHFEFQALAATKPLADRLLLDAWEIHCRDYPDADMGMMLETIDDGDVNYLTIASGGVLRDGETLL